jgi:crotonobetainyl-CoA:carnitine CoA-transferase CaiB-like acyl-CoA transferase
MQATGPLRGLRVIDFTHFVAGPYATLILADMGAEVIKVENPGRGDEFRHYPPYSEKLDGEGAPYLWVNRNKKSVAVDLKTPEGKKVVRELIRNADIVVENFSTGVMERFGLGYDELAAEQPNLIFCSVSAYGRSGPFAARVGFDPIVQAESGFMSLNGYPDREGVRTGSSVMDIGTAMMAANGILGAVVERFRTGRGQRVETSLFGSAMNVVGYSPLQVLSDPDWKAGRHGNSSPDTSPTGVFYASNGPIYIASTGTEIFQRLCRAIGREDMATDERLQDKAGRLQQRDELFAAINEALRHDTRENWLAKFSAARVPAGAVRTVKEALASPESQALDVVSHIPHPTAGTIANIRLPITYSRTPLADAVAAPVLGQHTGEVLRSVLGFKNEHVEALNAAGVFGTRLRPFEGAEEGVDAASHGAQPGETPEEAVKRCPFMNKAA